MLSAGPTVAGARAGAGDATRLLRVMAPMTRRGHGDRSERPVGMAVAVRTTGPDRRRSDVVELATQRFLLDDAGRISETGPLRIRREQPVLPMDAAARRMAGIDAADLEGRSFCDAETVSALNDVDFVVAANASHSRPFLERRFPAAAGRPWACVTGDVGWRSLGFAGVDAAALAIEIGWYQPAVGAGAEVTTLLHLLDHEVDGVGIASRMLATAMMPTRTMETPDRPEVSRLLSRRAGWRLDRTAGAWRRSERCAAGGALDDLARRAAGLDGPLEVRFVTWRERYA